MLARLERRRTELARMAAAYAGDDIMAPLARIRIELKAVERQIEVHLAARAEKAAEP